MKRLCTTALLLAVVLAGCSPARPIGLPDDPAVVGSFEVTRWKGSFLGTHVTDEYTITDPRRIADILAFLKEHNTDFWHNGLLTEDEDYTVRLDYKNPDEPGVRFSFGKKWLSGSDWPTAGRARRISASERGRLVELFAKDSGTPSRRYPK